MNNKNQLHELSKEEYRDLIFLNELKSLGKEGEPDEKFIKEFSQELKSRFREHFANESKAQKIEFAKESIFFSLQKFFFPFAAMALLIVIVSLGFFNLGERRVRIAEKNKEFASQLDFSSGEVSLPKENIQNDLVLEIDALELLMNEQENDLQSFDNDLAFYEESIDGDFSLIENDLDIIFQ